MFTFKQDKYSLSLFVSILATAIQKQTEMKLQEFGLVVLSGRGGIVPEDDLLKPWDVLVLGPEGVLTMVRDRMEFLKHKCSSVGLVVLDEAHLVYEWGKTFREAYLSLPDMVGPLEAVILGMSATLNQTQLGELTTKLHIESNHEFVSASADRPNIRIAYTKKQSVKNTFTYMFELPHRLPKTVIFVSNMKQATNLYGDLLYKGRHTEINYAIQIYHGELYDEMKHAILEEFQKEDSTIRVLVSTIAFGVGVDIPDIRVIHMWGFPRSYQVLWQELGRAGRDGNPAVCFLHNQPLGAPQPEIKEFKKKIKEGHCMRQMIMDEISVHKFTLYRSKCQCRGQCEIPCICYLCRCCSNCEQKCPCGPL